MSNKVSLTTTRGDDRIWNISIVDSQGSPVNISTATYTSTIRKEYNSEIVGNLIVNILDAVEGKLELVLPSSLSTLLTVQTGKRNASYVFDLVQQMDGENTTYLNGYMVVEERVTPMVP